MARGNAYYNLKEYKKAMGDYIYYVSMTITDNISNLDSLKRKDKKHIEINPSVISRKLSRCMFHVKGIDETKKFMLSQHKIFNEPMILKQLAMFMDEAGYKKTGDYYRNMARKMF